MGEETHTKEKSSSPSRTPSPSRKMHSSNVGEESSAAPRRSESQSSQSLVFSCPECTYAFASQVFLYKHLKWSHNHVYCQMKRNGQITSAACQQITSQEQGDTEPRSSHNHQHLTKTLTEPGEVQTHQLTYTEKKTHVCKQCDESFNHLRQLKKHQRLHTGEKPFLCEQCKKSFNRLDSLKTHRQRIHTGETPFHCQQCDKSFSWTGDLTRHQRIHIQQKPFLCEKCDKSFIMLCYLKTHQRIHTGEKPYHCKQCAKAFSQLGNLKRHQRLHTPQLHSKDDGA